MEAVITEVNAWAWGVPMQVLLLGTGIFLTLGLEPVDMAQAGVCFSIVARRFQRSGGGRYSALQGLDDLVERHHRYGQHSGCRDRHDIRGPGALFWMWLTALFGMAMKYAEAVLAVRYREQDDLGGFSGGPMYYIRNGLGPRFAILSGAFALFGAMAGFGLANTVQSNSVAQVLGDQFEVHWLTTGLLLMVIVGAVILGGIRRIAATASAVVPVMAIAYVAMSALVIALHIEQVPEALGTIIDSAFNGASAAGGFAGASVWAAIRFGVARGIFSNEAGLGSAPIAHAAARTNEPVEQGLIAMLGTFIDTLVVCTMTGLVIMLTGVLESGISGASLTASAFGSAIPGGELVVTVGVVLFATTTMIGWSFYGERCVVYLFGTRGIMPFRVLWVLAIPVGAATDLGLIWLIADTLNAFMAIPNLIALLLLSPVVFTLSKSYFSRHADSVKSDAI